ncbi:MAG: hypothetical protein AB1705_05320 [Verrucomicrobiota bacterium]
MKPNNKWIRVVSLVAVAGFFAVTANAADIVAPPRAMALMKSYEKVGAAPGEKLVRALPTAPGRAAALAASYAKVGSAPGDKIDRSLKSIPPRVRENYSFRGY